MTMSDRLLRVKVNLLSPNTVMEVWMKSVLSSSDILVDLKIWSCLTTLQKFIHA